jgi:hypothetical protein
MKKSFKFLFLFVRFQFLEARCCDGDPDPKEVVVCVIRDPSAPYDVDVVVFEDRRIESDPENPLSLPPPAGVRALEINL